MVLLCSITDVLNISVDLATKMCVNFKFVQVFVAIVIDSFDDGFYKLM